MIYIINNANRARFRPLIDQLFQLHAASNNGVVNLLDPPNLPASVQVEAGREDAVYVIEADAAGLVTAGFCLLPSTEPNNMLEVLPKNAFATGKMVEDDAIYVLSHCFASYADGKLVRRRKLSALFEAVSEYGYRNGLTHIVALCEMESLSAFLAIDLIAIPLALPFRIGEDGRHCVVLLIELAEPAIGFSNRDDSLRRSPLH